MPGLNWKSYPSGAILNVGNYPQDPIGLNQLYNNAVDFFNSPPTVLSSGKITQWFSSSSYGSDSPPFSTFSLGAVTNIAIQFSGFFTPDKTGDWTIRLGGLLNNDKCDDLGILFLGEPDTTITPFKTPNILSNHEANQPSSIFPFIYNDYYVGTANSKTVTLQAGITYPILIYYNQGGGGYTFGLGFSFNGGSLITNFASITNTTYTPKYPCFKKDTKILTDRGYILIQNLKKGDLIKTLRNGYIPIDMIGSREIFHPREKKRIKEQLYKCSPNEYPELFEDLIITGCHSILVREITGEEKEMSKIVNGDLYITDNKYRIPACVDNRTSIYETPGNYTIYHLALENDDYYMNYGIFANGLLVESSSKRYMKEHSGMKLIE